MILRAQQRALLKRALALLAAALALAGLMYLAACGVQPGPGPGSLAHKTAGFAAYFIDVGQGDSILLVCNGSAMLVDAGIADSAGRITAFLDKMGLNTLEIVAATHPHADHIGGMEAVLNGYSVGTFIMPQAIHTTATFERMLDAVAENGCDREYAATGAEYTLGSAKITVLSPPEGESYSNLNNYSLVLAVEYDGIKILLCGDAEAPIEAALLDGGIGRFDLLKAGHHGSNTSSSQAFLDAVSPAHAVICCGLGNEYGHPHAEVLERLAEAQIWRTDKNGTITATISEGELYVSAEK